LLYPGSELLALQLGGLSTVALGYVGMDVTYTSSEMNWDGIKPVEINYALEKNASVLKVNIYDEAGTLVRSMDAPKAAGGQKVSWDGKDNAGNVLAEGTYKLKVDAADNDQKPITVSTAVSGNVRGIEAQNGVIFLLVGERAIALNTVIQATDPPAPTTGTAEDA
jgi:flagellar basal-body rod modification protein FlgD